MAPQSALADRAVVLKSQNIAAYNLAVQGFQQAFGGEVLVLELSGQDIPRAQAREIRDFEPKALIGIGRQATVALQRRFEDLPIVFCMVMNSQTQGLTGSNITGITLEIPPSEQVQSFRAIAPNMKSIGLIYNPTRANPTVEGAKQAIQSAGLTLVAKQVESPGDVPDAMWDVLEKADGFWLLPEATLITGETLRFILLSSLERRIPLMVFSAPFVREGALIGIVPNYPRIGVETANLAKRLIAGESGNDIPPMSPPSSLLINGGTATRLGLQISDEIRGRANILD